jgi:hypothetical protein
MDQAPEGQAGPARGRRGASGVDASSSESVDAGGSDAARAAARGASGVDAGSDAAAVAAAQQAICRILRGRQEDLDAVLLAWQAAADASSAAVVQQLISAGCDRALPSSGMALILQALARLCGTRRRGRPAAGRRVAAALARAPRRARRGVLVPARRGFRRRRKGCAGSGA